MLASEADWISPGRNDGYGEDPPAWSGKTVSLLDTDHIWGVGGNAVWVWKAFTRGHNPLFMDPYDSGVFKSLSNGSWDEVRRAMGRTRRLAERVNLAAMTPRNDLASTKYCLANPGKEYLAYLPDGGEVTVDLSAATGALAVEWFNPRTGAATDGGTIQSGAIRSLKPPFTGDAVLYLRRKP
jgi:hypothetical protein